MPHLVSLLRPSVGNMPSMKNPVVSRSRATSRTTSQATSRNTSRNPSPHARSASSSSGHEDHAVKFSDLTEALKKHHLLPLHFGRPAKDHHNQAHHHTYSPATIGWTLESPSIILYGTPEESTGALVSGQLALDIKEDVLDIESFSASLELVETHKRPFHANCSDCQTQTTVIKQWTFLSHPITMNNGKHYYPFSTLLNGRLPASVNTPVVSLSYVLRAEAVVATATSTSAAVVDAHSFSTIAFTQTLDVKRSLPEPLYPHNSVRVFPPTNIKAAASYKSIIDATGSNTMTLKLDGLLTHNEKFGTVDLWRLKKMTWKLEETIKAVAPACDRHRPSLPGAVIESDQKTGHPRSETRIIGENVLFEGWKSDYTGNDGTLDMEFDFCVNRAARSNSSSSKGTPNGPNFACDVSTQDGTTSVSHSLCLELVMSKEYAQEGKTHMSHQTGTGRILRMHFAVILTHNAGMGLSWDNEAPPVYEDVPPSPPCYQWEEDPIEYDDLEELDAARAATAPNSRRQSQVGL